MMETIPSTQNAEVSPRHALLINLGRGSEKLPPPNYHITTYVFSDHQRCTTSIAGLALWWWLEHTNRPPVSVLFACTDTAWRDKADAAQAEALRLGLPWERIDHAEHEVPRALDQIWQVLPPLEEWLGRHGARQGDPLVLHLDLTHAYRAIPLAHTWMSLYLQRRGLIVPGVWGYGAFNEKEKEETPYLDLSHLFDLAEWAEAVRAFRDRLDTSALASLLDPLERTARRAAVADGAPPPGQLGALVRAARTASAAFQAGLPLEVGLEARSHLGGVTAEAVRDAASALLPFHAPLAEELFEHVSSLAVTEVAKKNPKVHLVLDERELARQLRLVEAWVRAGMVDAAMRAFRELIVSRVLFARGTPAPEWLQRNTREGVASQLWELAKKTPPRPLVGEEQALRTLWRGLGKRRNPLAHAGMEIDTVNVGEARHSLEHRLLPEFKRLHALNDVWLLADIPEGPPKEGNEG